MVCEHNTKTNFSASKKRQKTILAKAVALALLVGSVVPATGWAATISGVKFVDDNRTGGERQTIGGILEPAFTGGGDIYLKLASAPATEPPSRMDRASFADGSYSIENVDPGTYKVWQYVNPTSPLFDIMSASSPEYFASEGTAKSIIVGTDDITLDFPVPNLTLDAEQVIAESQSFAESVCSSTGSDVITISSTWPTVTNDNIVIIPEGETVDVSDTHTHVQAICNYGTLVDNNLNGLTITYDALFANLDDGRVEGKNPTSMLQINGSDIRLKRHRYEDNSYTQCDADFNAAYGCDYYGLFYNENIIQAGNGLNREHATTVSTPYSTDLLGGKGGEIDVEGFIVVQNGTVQAGNGGNVNFVSAGTSGNGSGLYEEVLGGDGGAVVIVAGNTVTGSAVSITASGNGGDVTATNPCTNSSGGPCTGHEILGGDSGALTVGANTVLVKGVYKGQSIWIDPTVSFMGSDTTLIAEQDVVIFGGDNWLLELRELSPEAITAGNKIILATGPGGTIDLRGNNANIFKAGVQVEIYTDNLLLDEGVTIESLVDAPNGVIVGPARIIYHAVITGSSQLIGTPNEILPIRLDLQNAGPEVDTYTLAVSSENGWTITGLPSSITIDGLGQSEVALNVALPAEGNDTITITATSQADSTVVATTEIRVSVAESVDVPDCAHAEYVVDEKLIRIPFLDIPLLDPITQSPTGEVAVSHVDLSLMEGSDDFKVIPNTLEVKEIVPEASECHAVYNYDGTLRIPNLDVEKVIILPPGIVAESIVMTYEATMRQLPLSPNIFHLQDYLLK